MAYPAHSSLANRKFLHFSYALEALKDVEGEVLDVGCGIGNLTNEIKKFRPDLKITGCDKEYKHLDYFRQHFGGRVNVTYCDAHKLSFGDASFNAVLLLDVLEHLTKPEDALREIHRVLKQGGVFHLAVPCERSLMTWDGWLYRFFKLNLKRHPVGHIRVFTFEEIKKMLKDQGFDVVDFHFSQHFLDQLFSLLYYLFVGVFRHGQYFNLRQKGEGFLFPAFLLKLGAWLSNFESKIFQGVRGRALHITSKK